MGERKGTNLYYPPDYDPKKGGLNKFLGTHALRERARKLHLGILIIRFEMPYNIWCDGCNNHIGMGVRYNAEKKKVGMYYSTPVYQFRMKCHLCDNHFEIKTDPANLDYIIVSGARRQENRWDPKQNEQVVPEDKNTQKKLFDDSMFKLEHEEDDKMRAKMAKDAARRLIARREELWHDDFSANSALRQKFRATRKAVKAQEARDREVIGKYALDITLVPESDQDKKMASLLALKPSKSLAERCIQSREEIINAPVLPNTAGVPAKIVKKRTHFWDNVATPFGIVKRSKTKAESTCSDPSKAPCERKVEQEREMKKHESSCDVEEAQSPNRNIASPSFSETSPCSSTSVEQPLNTSLSLISDCYDSNDSNSE